jgi:hypothetical protein
LFDRVIHAFGDSTSGDHALGACSMPYLWLFALLLILTALVSCVFA